MIDKIFSNASSAIINVAALSWIASKVGGWLKWLFMVYLKNYCVGATIHGNYAIQNIISHLIDNTTGRSNRLLNGNRMINGAQDKPKLDFGVYYIIYKKRLVFLYSWKDTAMNEKGYSQFLGLIIFGMNRQTVLNEILRSSSPVDRENKILKIDYSSPSNGRYTEEVYKDEIKDVVYGENQRKVVKYISNWIENESIYRSMNRAFKIGMLLYGKPGTGKTSSIDYYAKVIHDLAFAKYKEMLDKYAMELIIEVVKMPSFYQEDSISDIKCYISNMNEGLANTRRFMKDVEMADEVNLDAALRIKYSVYVIEEIDRYFYDNNGKEIYFKGESELMNLLDGDSSPDNAVIIMTTNYADRIPKVLLRPGRTDVVIEFKELTKEEAEEMCNDNGCKLSDIYREDKESYNPAALELDILSYRLGGAFNGSNVGGVGRDVGISKKD